MKNNSIEIFKRIQRELEDAKTQSNILKGKLLSLSSQLKVSGFKNIKDAKRQLPKLKIKLKKQEEEFEILINQFKNKYLKERI